MLFTNVQLNDKVYHGMALFIFVVAVQDDRHTIVFTIHPLRRIPLGSKRHRSHFRLHVSNVLDYAAPCICHLNKLVLSKIVWRGAKSGK
jgi:hypothetical protein